MNGNTAAGTFENQPDLLARLQNVVRQLNRSDIRTVSALIAKAMGDQQAAMMAVRLLHWFPKAKKLGGWVYKSWRDWNAECNLSQAQVKRVHGKGLLEAIGIERTIMKANGTPTVHYRLDENRLIQKLAEFLEIIPIRITAWMWPEPPNQDGQSDPSQVADSDQSNGRNQPNSLSENNPMNSAKTAQSITDFPSQTQQHTPHQDRQHNTYSAVVMDTQKRNPDDVIQALGRLGISSIKAKQLMQKYGAERVLEVVNHAEDQSRNNPAGYVIRALADNQTIYSTPEKEDYAWGDGSAYITGKYASFIEHQSDQNLNVLQKQQHKPDSVVVDSVQGTEMRMVQSMGEVGIGFSRSIGQLEVHGVDRIESVIQHTKILKRHNPVGYVIRARELDDPIRIATRRLLTG